MTNAMATLAFQYKLTLRPKYADVFGETERTDVFEKKRAKFASSKVKTKRIRCFTDKKHLLWRTKLKHAPATNDHKTPT